MTALLIATRNAHKAREIQRILPADYLCLTLSDFPGAPAAVEDGVTFAANASKKVSVLADWLATAPGRAGLRRAQTRFQPGGARLCRAVESPPTPFYILADDSGLEVDALGGAPGVHSARFAALDNAASALPAAPPAANSSDLANNAKLLRLLDGVPPSRRTARFRCVLALRSLCVPSPTAPRKSHSSHPSHFPPPPEPVLFEGLCEGRIGLQPAGAGGFGYDPLFIPDGFAQSFAELGEGLKNTLSHRAQALQKLSQFLATPL